LVPFLWPWRIFRAERRNNAENAPKTMQREPIGSKTIPMNSVYEADSFDSMNSSTDNLEDDIAELSDDEAQHLEDLIDSRNWYRKRGWTSQVERCNAELERRLGTTETAELEAMFESREAITKTERQQELEDVRDAAEWMDDHGWEQAAEDQWERYRALKEGGES